MQKALFFLFLSFVSQLHADPIVSISRLSTPINFDGIVDDKAWEAIDPLPLVMTYPTFKGDMTEETIIRIAYDDDYIYLSGINYDTEPDKIMANTKKRDALTGTTEWFGFIIDSFNDNENACGFFTTPTGLRMDAQVTNDALGRNPINLSWNNFWDVKTTRDNKGWYVEMRVPFSSIPFSVNENDEVTMAITTWRYIARKGELQIFPEVSSDFGDFSTWQPSQAHEFTFKKIKPSKPFYITPYALSGTSTTTELNDTESSYISENKIKKEIGLDIKYGINNNWNLDVSLNTDFAQVEVDDQQVNLTRFSLFFPEKRLFFQERSGVFNFNMDRTNQLFYSRRIGIDEDGNQQRILGGARLVGRAGNWDLGLINMHTADSGEQFGENFTVVRAKSRILNERSNAGFILTNRTDLDGTYNTSYGLDASLLLFRQDFLYVRWAQSFDSDVADNNPISTDPSFIKIWMSRNANKGFSYGYSVSFAGKDFAPALGFQQRNNYLRLGNRMDYGFDPGAKSKIFRHGFASGGVAFWTKDTKKIESLSWRAGYEASWKNGMAIQARIRPRIENLVEPFELSDDAIIPTGKYNYNSYSIELNTPTVYNLTAETEIERGGFYDGDITSIEIGALWAVNSSMELTASYNYNKATFDARNDSFNAHLLGLKTLFTFSTKVSLAAFLQYNSLEEKFGGNIRFRYNPSEGNDLYIVYNDDLNIRRRRLDPELPLSNQRQLLVKYSYSFRL